MIRRDHLDSTLQGLVDRLDTDSILSFEIVVVDDGSSDRTAGIARDALPAGAGLSGLLRSGGLRRIAGLTMVAVVFIASVSLPAGIQFEERRKGLPPKWNWIFPDQVPQ